MTSHQKNPPLLGYVDQISARAGETLEFKVSSGFEQPFTARLMRSICADPNPEGAGIVEEDASAYFESKEFASVDRPFFPGSYGVGRSAISIDADTPLVFSANVFATLRSDEPKAVLSVGAHSLCLDASGAACLRVGEVEVSTATPLTLLSWYRLEGRVEAGNLSISQHPLGRDMTTAASSEIAVSQSVPVVGKPVVAARASTEVFDHHFDGKIEAPSIVADGQTVCAWDFSRDISTTVVPAITGPDLDLVNFPARAMTGTAWDGSEMNWTHRPEHYAAIHFHSDDIYDFGWDTDFTFTLPLEMPSGVYVMRLECAGQEDAIPFFVAPPKGQRRGAVCVLVSTFTYSIYGNHARPDYEPSWQERNKAWGAYPHNPAEYPQYGLSTYNFHSDGSGICHSSHRRPLFNMRPGYLTFGNAACSGLRHFQADSHLLSWLHAKGIDYDLVTDQHLHTDGHAAIAGYKAVITGSHPEYHTEQTLDALRDYRDTGGHLLYLGGNGFYWRVAIHPENDSVIEIRRAEDGIRAWAAEPGEYYNAFDGAYGGLWRRNGRAPQDLVGVGFTAQGTFVGDPYQRECRESDYDWVFDGVSDDIIGDFGFSGNGAAGFELDHMDYRIGTPANAVLLARSVTRDSEFMLVPEEQLTHLTNLTGGTEAEAKHADMIYIEYPDGGSVFSTGSITFCGCLPWNNFDNNISRLLENVVSKALS